MKRALLTCVLLLAGCTTQAPSHDYVGYYLNKTYDGHPLSDFVVDYGYPVSQTVQGGKVNIYRWVSLHPRAMQPVVQQAEVASTHYTYPNGYKQSRDILPNGNYKTYDAANRKEAFNTTTERYYCEIYIYTDASDTIQNFFLAVDSTGKISNSRCAEIFDGVTPYEW